MHRSSLSGAERAQLFDAQGELAAVYVLRAEAGVLEVPVLRVQSGTLAPTLTRQILLTLRREALTRGANAIRLADPQLDRQVSAAAGDDGFVEADGGMVGLVLDFVGSARGVTDQAKDAAASVSLPPPFSVRPHLAPLPAAEIERIWWPVKVLDSDLLTYVVPIQQRFSRELLGAPLSLFARDSALGLGREHVYYRSPRGTRMQAPARILWYMSRSAKGSVEPAAIVAASLLEEVVEGTPDELQSRFRHLGVWRAEQIADAARAGRAQALRFTYTETFERPVRGRALSSVLTTAPQSPRLISGEAFGRLYQKARGNV
jgi:hypothetical protein